MSTRYSTRSLLSPLSEILTFSAMLGLTAASAAVLASPLIEESTPVVHRLPTVVITGKSTPEVHKLPTVVVIGKRSSS